MDNGIKRYIKILLQILIVVAIFSTLYLFYYIYPYIKLTTTIVLGALIPFIIALIIAILVEPIVIFLENKLKFSRSFAVIFSLLLVFGIILVLLIMASSRLIIELVQLSDNLSDISNHFITLGWQMIREIRTFISSNPLPVGVQESVEENITHLFGTLKDFLGKSTELLVKFLATLPLVFTIAIVTFVATYFISKDKELIVNFVINLLPVKWVLPLNNLFLTMSSALVGFFRAQTILITLTGIQTMIGLHILGVDYAFTIGLVVAILDLIPILGPGTLFIPWVMWNFILGKYKFAVALLILYAFLTIIRQMIEPKIIAKNIGLHPLATLMSVFIGLRIMGVMGIIIGPIFLIIIKSILQTKFNKGVK